MFFIVHNNTILGKSTQHPSLCFQFDEDTVNEMLIIEKEDMSLDEVVARGILYFNGDVIFADQSPYIYKGVHVATKCDVDRVTQNAIVNLFNAYGGEEKFNTELALYSSGMLSAEEEAALQAKLQPVIDGRAALIAEGNAFVNDNALESVCH